MTGKFSFMDIFEPFFVYFVSTHVKSSTHKTMDFVYKQLSPPFVNICLMLSLNDLIRIFKRPDKFNSLQS